MEARATPTLRDRRVSKDGETDAAALALVLALVVMKLGASEAEAFAGLKGTTSPKVELEDKERAVAVALKEIVSASVGSREDAESTRLPSVHPSGRSGRRVLEDASRVRDGGQVIDVKAFESDKTHPNVQRHREEYWTPFIGIMDHCSQLSLVSCQP